MIAKHDCAALAVCCGQTREGGGDKIDKETVSYVYMTPDSAHAFGCGGFTLMPFPAARFVVCYAEQQLRRLLGQVGACRMGRWVCRLGGWVGVSVGWVGGLGRWVGV